MKPISGNPSKADMQPVGAFIEAFPKRSTQQPVRPPTADRRSPLR